MTTSALERRRLALEERFFRKRDEALRECLRRQAETERESQALADACGLSDAGLVRPLVEHGIRLESLVALVLVPLVAVAWADSDLSPLERRELLSHARDFGLFEGNPCEELLAGWMESPPGPELLEAWIDYTRHLVAGLDSEQRRMVETEVLGRARAVARADGGVLRIGRLISAPEQEVLERLEAAFEG